MNKENKKIIYLNNAATSFPKPKEVKDAVLNTLDSFIGLERGTENKILSAEHFLLKARNAVAKFFSVANTNRVVFTQNCTESLNMAIKGVLRNGDHVIMDNTTHNSIARPLITLENEGFITLSRLSPKKDFYFDLDEIKSLVSSKTKLIVIAHASNVTGIIQDIKKIGSLIKDRECLFLVDAAQSAGQIPINIQEMYIDLLATAGHKSLFGPSGTGILYVSDKVKDLKTIKEGGTGSKSESLTQPTSFPHILESGTHNIIGIAGLVAGIEFINKTGLKNIREHEVSLTQRLIERIKKFPGVKIYGLTDATKICSVVSITIDGFDVTDCGQILADSFNIITRAGLHCAPLAHDFLNTKNSGGTLRISPGYFNTLSEIDCLIEAISELVACQTAKLTA